MDKVSVKEITEELTIIIKDELVATYIESETTLEIRLMNGQRFLMQVTELV